MAHLKNKDMSITSCPTIAWESWDGHCWNYLSIMSLEEVHSKIVELVGLHVDSG